LQTAVIGWVTKNILSIFFYLLHTFIYRSSEMAKHWRGLCPPVDCSRLMMMMVHLSLQDIFPTTKKIKLLRATKCILKADGRKYPPIRTELTRGVIARSLPNIATFAKYIKLAIPPASFRCNSASTKVFLYYNMHVIYI
jgi:hypothetical protein